MSTRNSGGGNNEYSLRSTGTAYELYVRDGGVTSATASAAGTVVLNEWTHLCGVKINNDLFLYINGVQAATATAAYGAFTFDGLFLGCTIFVSIQSPFQGAIDDARIYSRAPSPSEIRRLASKRAVSYELRRSNSRLSFPSAPLPSYMVARIGGS
jgi:hypothetical protein